MPKSRVAGVGASGVVMVGNSSDRDEPATVLNRRMPALHSLRPSTPGDAGWIAELRAEVMRPDLERLDRFDPSWVRERFLRSFAAEHTRVIEVGGHAVGSIAVRPEPGERWIEHFYLADGQQGRGIGGAVLHGVLGESPDARPFRLNVLQGSAARRLYERHGFVFEREDAIDVFLVRHPSNPT